MHIAFGIYLRIHSRWTHMKLPYKTSAHKSTLILNKHLILLKLRFTTENNLTLTNLIVSLTYCTGKLLKNNLHAVSWRN